MALAARVYEAAELQRRPKRRTGDRARRARARTAGKGAIIAAFAALPVALILAYVWLTAELTAQTYRLHDGQARQTALVQRDNDLRQQVAKLESLPRLEAAAARLHMTVPPGVALLSPPAATAHAAAPQTVFAASLAGFRKWFGLR